MSLIKRESPAKIMMIAALAEGPILIAGVLMYLQTNNLAWIVGAAVLGALVMIPAVLRAKKIQEQNNASR